MGCYVVFGTVRHRRDDLLIRPGTLFFFFGTCQFRFGMPALFVTINLNDTSSPLLLQLAGCKLGSRDIATGFFDAMPPRSKRFQYLANHPLAAVRFQYRTLRLIIDKLFGWDLQENCSKPEGGIFGHLRCFYATQKNSIGKASISTF